MVLCTKPDTEMTFSKSVLNEKTRGKKRYFLLITEISFFSFSHHHHHQNRTKQTVLLQLGTFANELPKSPLTGDFPVYAAQIVDHHSVSEELRLVASNRHLAIVA